MVFIHKGFYSATKNEILSFTVIALPPPSWGSGCPALFATCLFFSAAYLLLFFLSFFFSLGGVSLSRGLCWSGPGLSVGVRMLLSSPGGLCLPKQSGSWHLAVSETSWFLHLTWSGDAMHGLGVWRCWSFASSWWFFLQGVSPASLQDFTLGSTLSASSL
jgi:hypothetical protein